MPTHINDLPIIDATEPLMLEVESCDKEGASPGNPQNCVAAKGLKRMPGVVEARVYRSRVYIRMNGAQHWTRYTAPRSLAIEEEMFDRAGEFEPQKFKLSVLKPSSRTDGTRQGGEDKPK